MSGPSDITDKPDDKGSAYAVRADIFISPKRTGSSTTMGFRMAECLNAGIARELARCYNEVQRQKRTNRSLAHRRR